MFQCVCVSNKESNKQTAQRCTECGPHPCDQPLGEVNKGPAPGGGASHQSCPFTLDALCHMNHRAPADLCPHQAAGNRDQLHVCVGLWQQILLCARVCFCFCVCVCVCLVCMCVSPRLEGRCFPSAARQKLRPTL